VVKPEIYSEREKRRIRRLSLVLFYRLPITKLALWLIKKFTKSNA